MFMSRCLTFTTKKVNVLIYLHLLTDQQFLSCVNNFFEHCFRKNASDVDDFY